MFITTSFVYAPDFKPPSTFAVSVTVPDAIVVSVLPDTIAPVVPASFTSYVTVLFVAFDGSTVPVSCKGSPAVPSSGLTFIFVTSIISGSFAFMFIAMSFVYFIPCPNPFATSTVIITVPAFAADNISPFNTAAVVPAFFKLNATALFVAFEGSTFAVNLSGIPTVPSRGFTITFVTLTNEEEILSTFTFTSLEILFASFVIILPTLPFPVK